MACVWAWAGALAASGPVAGQEPAVDSVLVARILLAEARRDSTDPALVRGAVHPNARVRALAIRARARIVDPGFSARDSLPDAALPSPPHWPEPAWKPRYRALGPGRDDCALLQTATRDAVVAVRLRAAAVSRESCAGNAALVATFIAWVDQVPATTDRRAPGAASWHLAAQGIVALARLQPDSALFRTRRLARHPQWQLRQHAARAATALRDETTLRRLARDGSANVAESALDGLAQIAGRAADSVALELLHHPDGLVVRAAARALKGSADPRVMFEASAAFERFVLRANASERDVRVALLEAAGRPASDDRPPPADDLLAADAVALALGAPRYLRVERSAEHGGGSFTVRLRGDVAPLMAARVLELARRGWYDTTSWHRVEHDFVIQGGSPGANEYVGYDRYLVDELGTVPHLRGTVGMSTRGHDTGDAQWFVNLRDNLRLNRDYTVFAEVVEGMDVVDGILEGDGIARIVEVSGPARPVRP